MATHDYVIDNSTGANVRSDLNSVLQAILSNNSSSSAPSTTAAYMWWADTTNGILKIRNSADNAWVELLQLDGTLTLEDGSASTPGLAFRDDLNTGIFSSAADTFNVATGGVERIELGATTIFNEDGADVDFRIEGVNEANLFYIDAGNRRIGIITSSPSDELHIKESKNGDVAAQVENTNTGSSARARVQLSSDSASLQLYATSAAYNGVSSWPDSGVITTGSGASGGLILNVTAAANIKFQIQQSEKMRIDSSGKLLIGASTADTGGVEINKNITAESDASDTANYHLVIKSQSNSNTSKVGIAFKNTSSATHVGAAILHHRTAGGSVGDLAFYTSGTESSTTQRMIIDKNGHIGIAVTPNTAWPSNGDFTALQIGSGACVFGRSSGDEDRGGIAVNYYHTGSAEKYLANGNASGMLLNDGDIDFFVAAANSSGANAAMSKTTAMRIAADGDIGIGTLDPNRTIEIKKSSPGIRLEETSSGGSKRLEFFLDSSEANIAAPQSSQTIMFSVSGADTMRLARSGSHAEMFLNTTSVLNTSVLSIATNGSNGIGLRTGATNSQSHISFQSPNGVHGTITTNGANTQYNTSSDYRLKENVTAISDGITRIKNLLPKRFNFILKPDVTQDGFLAHEVSSVVPEAVSGDKDAVDSNGDVVSQQFDSSKLVPLLVAAVQELITKVETLEAA